MPPVNDPMLRQALQNVEKSVPEKYRRGYDQIMAMALELMFGKKTFSVTQKFLGAIKGPDQIPKAVAHGVTKLLALVFKGSGEKMQLEASGSAATALSIHGLEYVDQVMKIEVTKEILSATTRLVIQGLMAFLQKASKLDDENFKKAITPGGAQSMQTGPPSNGVPPGVPAPGMVEGV